MWLLVGLGNPGDEYADNRHNAGFLALDRIAEEYGFPAFRNKFHGAFSEGKIAGEKVILLKPQTYMNESGQSVAAAAKFFKIPPARIAAFHDELDLEPFKVRVKCGGGNAGHNGLKSIQAHLGTPDFWRVRIGIGHPGDKDRVHSYVLSDFSKAEQKTLPAYLGALSRHVELLLSGKESDYMTRVAEDVKN